MKRVLFCFMAIVLFAGGSEVKPLWRQRTDPNRAADKVIASADTLQASLENLERASVKLRTYQP